ncbi:hypothetical protein GE061_007890 [Apolygus lucorum]|uniref:Uncharacterized protein n=1 Tax=Apolygus lucorum TaxID=248454 RepID=A0A8S9WN64_APOLU|nr:hypothetical protein GE061_007890 [Apolygus lucorum]
MSSVFVILNSPSYRPRGRKVPRGCHRNTNRSDIELIDQEESWEPSDQLEKCLELLKICDSIDLKELSPADISKLHHTVHIAVAFLKKQTPTMAKSCVSWTANRPEC